MFKTIGVYVVFAVFFLLASLQQLDIEQGGQLFQSVDWKFTQVPFGGDRRMQDVASANDLYAWLQDVFVAGVFSDMPELGDDTRYCVPGSPCGFGEGHVDYNFVGGEGAPYPVTEKTREQGSIAEHGSPPYESSSCAFGLKAGTLMGEKYSSNCPFWMGPGTNCCTPYGNEPYYYYGTYDMNSCMDRCTSDLEDDCKCTENTCDCKPFEEESVRQAADGKFYTAPLYAQVPDYYYKLDWDDMAYLPDWDCLCSPTCSTVCVKSCREKCKALQVIDVSFACESEDDDPGEFVPRIDPLNPQTCPESLPSEAANRKPMVSSYNRPIFARLSLKRYKHLEVVNSRFRMAVKTRIAPRPLYLQSFDQEYEDTEPFGGYSYTKEGGYLNAGAYVEFLDLGSGAATVRKQLADLAAAGWFDNQRLGSFAVEQFFYNGNLDTFMKITYEFQQNPSGMSSVHTQITTFNLEQYDLTVSANVLRLVFWAFVVATYLTLLKQEFEDVADDFLGYMSRSTVVLDITSLSLSFVVCCMIMIMGWSPEYVTFKFPIHAYGTPDYAVDFDMLNMLSGLTDTTRDILAVNICFVLIRAIMLVSSMSLSLAAAINTVYIGRWHFAYFGTLMLCFFSGFVLCAYFMFGHAFGGTASLDESLLTCFKMLFGTVPWDPDKSAANDNYRNEFVEANAVFGTPFFLAFMVIFKIILLNCFLAIIISAYDAERKRVASLSEDADPLSRALKALYDIVPEVVRSGIRRAAIFRALGGGATRSTNQDRLKELRAVQKKPRETLCSFECCLLLAFLSVYVLTYINLRYSSIAFSLKQAVELPIERDIGEVRRLEDVYGFLQDVVADELMGCAVDPLDATSCVSTSRFAPRREDFQIYQGPCTFYPYEWGLLERVDSAGPSEAGCNHDGDPFIGFGPKLRAVGTTPEASRFERTYRLTEDVESRRQPRFSEFNVGLDQWNFARLTVQPNCYRRNPKSRWVQGYKTLIVNPLQRECAGSDCLEQTMDLTNGLCHDYEGYINKPGYAVFNTEHLTYKWRNKGTYRDSAAWVVGLGSTAAEASVILDELAKDRVFSANSASIVLDFVSYNGNVDMMTHTVVSFSLDPTGLMSRDVDSRSFTLNVFDGGAGMSDLEIRRGQALILVAVYIFLYFWSMYIFILDLKLQYEICWEQSTHVYLYILPRFLIYFFQDDWWHLVDVVSMVSNAYVIVLFMEFFYMPGNAVPTSVAATFTQAKLFSTIKSTDSVAAAFETVDTLETLGDKWEELMMMSSYNSLLLSLRILKYLPSMPQLKVLLRAMQNGLTAIVYCIFMVTLLLIGFMMLMHNTYGLQVYEFGSPGRTFTTLFRWLCGDFSVDHLYKISPITLPLFILFMLIFYFIITNLFLAIIVNNWRGECYGPLVSTCRSERDRVYKGRDCVDVEEVVKHKWAVVRGPDWDLGGHGNEDGGPGERGEVISIQKGVKKDHTGREREVKFAVVVWRGRTDTHEYVCGQVSSKIGADGQARKTHELALEGPAQQVSISEGINALRATLEEKLKNFLGGAGMEDKVKTAVITEEQWREMGSLQLHYNLGLFSPAIKERHMKRIKTSDQFVKLRQDKLREDTMKTVIENCVQLPSELEDDGGGVGLLPLSPQRAGAAGKHGSKLHLGSPLRRRKPKDNHTIASGGLSLGKFGTTSDAGFMETPVPEGEVEVMERRLGQETNYRASIHEFLKDALYTTLEVLDDGGQPGATADRFGFMRSVCQAAQLPEPLTDQQRQDVVVGKQRLLARLSLFAQWLELESTLKALELEKVAAQELLEVVMGQNLVLHKHVQRLDDDVTGVQMELAKQQRSISQLRRGCEALA